MTRVLTGDLLSTKTEGLHHQARDFWSSVMVSLILIEEKKKRRWIIRTGKVKNETEFCLSGWCAAKQPEERVCGSIEQLPVLSGWMFVAFPPTDWSYLLLLHLCMGRRTGTRPVQGFSCTVSFLFTKKTQTFSTQRLKTFPSGFSQCVVCFFFSKACPSTV